MNISLIKIDIIFSASGSRTIKIVMSIFNISRIKVHLQLHIARKKENPVKAMTNFNFMNKSNSHPVSRQGAVIVFPVCEETVVMHGYTGQGDAGHPVFVIKGCRCHLRALTGSDTGPQNLPFVRKSLLYDFIGVPDIGIPVLRCHT